MSHLCVIGLGGVGGYFGYKLARRYGPGSGTDISFVARGATFDAVSESGFVLISPETDGAAVRPAHLGRTPDDVPPADVYLVCTKEYDLDSVCESLRPRVGPDTVMLPLLNGVDINERIRTVISSGIVLPSCVYISSHIRQKGVVEHSRTPGHVICGPDPLRQDFLPDTLLGLLRGADIHVTFTEAVHTEIWTKFLFISPFGLVTARHRAPIGKVLEDPGMRATAVALMHEVLAVAISRGVHLPEALVGRILERQKSTPYNNPTSLMLDVLAGKTRNELDIFAGTVIRFARQAGVPVPEMETIYGELSR